MSFLLSFVSCKPFLYLIGSLSVAGIFSIIHKSLRGESAAH